MAEMTRRKMRAMLWNWGEALKTIKEYEHDLRVTWEIINESRNTLSVQNLDGMPHGSGISDPTERACEQVEQRINDYKVLAAATDSLIRSKLAEKRAIDAALSDLPGLQQRVLRMHYQDNKTFAYIGIMLNYDERSIQRFEEVAIDKLCNSVAICRV